MIIYPDSKTDSVTSEYIDKLISDKKHVFILIYMEGCGPCNATRPEWAKLENLLNPSYSDRDDVAVINIERQMVPKLKSSLGNIDGFPSLKYITDKGKTITEYEDSLIKTKDRSSDSFLNWIESIIMPVVSEVSSSSVKTNNDNNVLLLHANTMPKSRAKSRSKKHRKTRKYKRRRNTKSKRATKSKNYSK
jgi:thiol-disulfide isomerase/thioredoxin